MLSLVSRLDALNVSPGRLFIDGQWLDWPDARFDQINPCTNEVMTSFAEAGTRGVALAVAAARKAFDEGPWPRMRAQTAAARWACGIGPAAPAHPSAR
ncbi:hypothetical protein WS58_16375 [Burkholderia pseudomultivorans]|uniref:aldehyde dehydrogenase family protein n=1 Tax=Burkholderia pseudomultivorans TaxID=1207504 RepID=UPI00075EA5E7|nr:aldehyde dehydrogenase family protein [Burkholderia pseudomultivorans]AOI94098.1 hypothetical protein WS57_34820 [Burkholderia pseudomultivorans]KVC27746.1 hypothetical protein WS55_12745 [Burkholderia pseudomultivorans]KVC36868.1 hypothetical protein WS56_00115 [Burkholderia pseudomultivorans]KVC42109.1 hypothetical protein WS58_16375 [Burkholderia pseudomultivorans]